MKFEEKLIENFNLKILLIIHIVQLLFKYLYPIFVLVNIKNFKISIFYLILNFVITTHWLFLKKECILSYLEKKIINNNYILGDKPLENPSVEYLYSKLNLNYKNNYLYIVFFYVLPIINVFIVSFYTLKNKKNLLIVNLLFLFLTLINLHNYYIL